MLPSSVTSMRHQERPLRQRCDVVVIGTGAGGGMAAHQLAMAGLNVIAIEQGSFLTPAQMTQREEQMLPLLFAEAGGRATSDLSVTILQGQGVGGSTLHNTNLCKRLPDEIRQQWVRDEGLEALADTLLDDDFRAIEAMLNVHPVPDERVNTNNQIMARGITALGYRGGRLSHNRDEACRASGFCELGCAYNGKVNAYKACIQPVLGRGLRLLTDARVDRIDTAKGRAVGVRGVASHVEDSTGVPFQIKADAVVLAASATGSPALVMQSKLPDPHRLVGTNLRMHPGAVAIGLMRERVEGWRGNPQSTECTEFLDFQPGSKRRVWLVAGAAHPAGAAVFMPGFGAQHAALMRQLPFSASVIAMLHDHSRGSVRPGPGNHIDISYRLDDDDRGQLALGLREAARILLAGGAERVLIPVRGGFWIRDEGDLHKLQARDIAPHNPTLTAVHPMGTLWMGADPSRSLTSVDGAYHHVDNLWVADGSLFPTSIGGPPQISIYTFGRRVARAVVTALGRA